MEEAEERLKAAIPAMVGWLSRVWGERKEEKTRNFSPSEFRGPRLKTDSPLR